MKKYIQPEINEEIIILEDVIAASAVDSVDINDAPSGTGTSIFNN